jgi:lysophospholipase L1-like esterase
MQHDNQQAGYTKYFPNQSRIDHDKDTGEVFEVTINGRGFRGEDFSDAKAPGSTRVVTLGASSTFGYNNRDETTYPVYLERFLNERARDGRKFEVINLGIPHLRSEQIHDLFVAEALPLHPDVVTFYEGINDSAWKGGEDDPIWKYLRYHFITFMLADGAIDAYTNRFSEEEVREHIEGKSEHFLANLQAMLEECRDRGILFVVVTQQAKSMLVEREDIEGTSYEDELKLVREKLRNEPVSPAELYFLTHAALMEGERNWARANHVPIVDGIEVLDPDRSVLLSWVHLSPKGNQRLADALAGEILAHM